MRKNARPPRAFVIPLIYWITAALWIAVSDHLVAGSSNHWQQTVKGLSFVTISAVLLYGLIVRRDTVLRAAEERAATAERMRCLGELASRITHDLGNVLMCYRTMLPLLRKHTDGSEAAENLVTQLENADKRAARIIGEITAFSRPHDPCFEPIALCEWLAQRKCELEAMVGSGVTVSVGAIAPTLVVDADELQLHRLLTNLVVNAAEAMERRGAIEIVATAARRDHVQISVSDHGPGIPPKVANTIFDPLVTTKRSGTGLGLAIVSRIAADHGGSVFFETQQGRGTTFHVVLPARHQSTVSPPVASRNISSSV